MFVPIMFPIAIRYSFFFAEAIVTLISGREVAIETAARFKCAIGIPNIIPTFSIPKIVSFAPRNSPIKLGTLIKYDFLFPCFLEK